MRLAVTVTIALGAGSLVAQAPADSLLRAAIAAAGGARQIAAMRALEWEARAVVHVPGRDVVIRGTWRVQAPDSAVVSTYDTASGPTATRRIIVSGARAWIQRDMNRPLTRDDMMPPELTAEELHQFYLYGLLRLLPLRDTIMRLQAVARDSAGNPGIRVERRGRLPATLYFDRADRVVRVVTSFATASGRAGDRQDIRLSGVMRAGGVSWFRRMEIRRNGAPYFDMELTSLRAMPRLADPLLRGPTSPTGQDGAIRPKVRGFLTTLEPRAHP